MDEEEQQEPEVEPAAFVAPEAMDAREYNRRLSNTLPPELEWSVHDRGFLDQLKCRARKAFKWTRLESLAATCQTMLCLQVAGRPEEALEVASFLSQLAFEDDFERWACVEPALALLYANATDHGGAPQTTRTDGDRSYEGGRDDEVDDGDNGDDDDEGEQTQILAALRAPIDLADRLKGEMAAHFRDEAELQGSGSAPERDALLALLGELLVLGTLMKSSGHAGAQACQEEVDTVQQALASHLVASAPAP